ncbi:C4-dicarboxylate ABC transporter, partial [Salmonella enterica subsp. enterica serovar Typhi]|nr:C4-dicarboxylate ABC transporter [Salmonella enterica subsp. enterica serovar Typhi]
MSSEFITLFMFGTMMVLLFTGQRVFGVIGFVGSAAALWLWGEGSFEMPFNATFQVLNWYPLITVPFFVF